MSLLRVGRVVDRRRATRGPRGPRLRRWSLGLAANRVLQVRRGLSELADTAADGTSDIGQLAGAKDDQDDHQAQDQLAGADVERHLVRDLNCVRRLPAGGWTAYPPSVAPTSCMLARSAAAAAPAASCQSSPRDAPAMPRDTFTTPGASVPWQLATAAASSPPCAPRPGTRKAGPGTRLRNRRRSSGRVAPTTSPTRPPGQRSATQRATRSCSSSPSTDRSCTVPALGLLVRART